MKVKDKAIYCLKNKQGITLIALIVTIIVLLILSGVTIAILFSDNGIINKAQNALDNTNAATKNELQIMNELENKFNDILNETVEIPEGLEIGSYVSYNPTGTYTWQAKYYSSKLTETDDDILLNSSSGEDFNISSWRVLSINYTNGIIELVPSKPTTGIVYLGQAQGYNNGVKLLNDACNSLYGNINKDITARNININDIEKYMTDNAILQAHDYADAIKYGNQIGNSFTKSNSNYPVIYAQEALSFINGSHNENAKLNLSEQNVFIERTEGTSATDSIGVITDVTSIQPYQTYWKKDATFMSTAFKNYNKQNNTIANYYDLIMPNGTNTSYWIASRCIGNNSSTAGFFISYVLSGSVDAGDMHYSSNITSNDSLSLFPIITLKSNSIKGDITSGFTVQ